MNLFNRIIENSYFYYSSTGEEFEKAAKVAMRLSFDCISVIQVHRRLKYHVCYEIEWTEVKVWRHSLTADCRCLFEVIAGAGVCKCPVIGFTL